MRRFNEIDKKNLQFMFVKTHITNSIIFLSLDVSHFLDIISHPTNKSKNITYIHRAKKGWCTDEIHIYTLELYQLLDFHLR